MRIVIKTFWPAAIFLVGATVLFCLPGDEFPERSWFEKIYFDKWVHIGLFMVLVLLWSLPMVYKIKASARLHKALIWIVVVFIVYGVAIEFVQKHFIPHRDFAVGDIAADALGCGLGFILSKLQSKSMNRFGGQSK